MEELGKLAQAQVLMLVSKVSNLITSAKAACNSHTWFTVFYS